MGSNLYKDGGGDGEGGEGLLSHRPVQSGPTAGFLACDD